MTDHSTLTGLKEDDSPQHGAVGRKFRCAICGDGKVTISTQSNSVPERDALGNLIGIRRGTPTAQAKCESGCVVAVRGSAPLTKLGEMMGFTMAGFAGYERDPGEPEPEREEA